MMLKIPSKYMQLQGIVYVCTGTIRAGQIFFIDPPSKKLWPTQTVRVLVSRKRRGVLRRRDIKFSPVRCPLWMGDD